jgi:hypothetical protein
VLEALLRLRQTACHPGLVDPARLDDPAAKLDTLLEQLTEVIDEGHKVLVFSQFTSFLSIVRRRLDERAITYEYLDGKTTYYPTAEKDSVLIPIASSSFLGTYFAKAPQNLPKGASYSYTAYLAVGSGDVASVQKVVYDLKDVQVRANGKEFVTHDTTPYGTLSGRVREANTLRPLGGVSVVLKDGKAFGADPRGGPVAHAVRHPGRPRRSHAHALQRPHGDRDK